MSVHYTTYIHSLYLGPGCKLVPAELRYFQLPEMRETKLYSLPLFWQLLAVQSNRILPTG